jgi:cell division protein FtsW
MKRGELDSRLLILVTLALVAFGLVMVYSATSAAAAVGGKNPTYYLERQGMYAFIGIALMMAAQRWDYRRLRALAPGLVVTSLALLAAVLVIGPAINGARRWISLGPAAFQPSELAKIALAVWVSAYLARKRAPRTLKELARPIGAVAGIACILILAEPDLGTAIAIVCMLASILLVSGTPGRMLATATSLVLAVGVFAIWLEPYRRARVFAFLNPWGDSQGAGFQVVQAMIGLGSGGLFGVGLGQGVQKIFYLPEAHTDMIFAIVGEELGLIGTLTVLALFLTLAYAGIRMALRTTDPFVRLVSASVTVWLAAQMMINLGAVTGVLPIAGVPLPFVSYGGSSLLPSLTAVGMLMSFARRRPEPLDPARLAGTVRERPVTGPRREGIESAPADR